MTYFCSAALRRFDRQKLISRVRFFVPVALVLALSLACLDDETPGDRLTTTTPVCPTGEVCSTTVGGLYFGGRLPQPHPLFAIALGGVQRISFRAVAPRAPVGLDASTPPDSGTGEPLPLPDFVVSSTSSEVQILSSNRLVVGVGEAMLLGVTSGTSRVRVTERESGRLLDRVEVRVAEVARVDLHAEECTWLPVLLGAATAGDDVQFGGCGAVWAGSEVRAALSLADSNGEPLWDDTLTHDDVAPTEVYSTFLTQGMVFDVRAPLTGELQFEVMGASGTHVARLPVVSDVADIWLRGSSGTRELTLGVGVPSVVCASGLIDAADESQGAILGAPATFGSDSAGLEIAPLRDAELMVGSPSACRSVTLTEPVPHRLTVAMGSVVEGWTVSPTPLRTTALRRVEPTTSPRSAASIALESQPGERLSE